MDEEPHATDMVSIYEPDKRSFEHGEHTADIWLMAKGCSFNELLHNMLEGLYGTISEAYSIEGGGEPFKMEFNEITYEELLADLLTEALFLLCSENVLLKCWEIELHEDATGIPMTMTIVGTKTKADIVQEMQGMEVKAVTRYGMSVKEEDGLWTAKVLLDI